MSHNVTRLLLAFFTCVLVFKIAHASNHDHGRPNYQILGLDEGLVTDKETESFREISKRLGNQKEYCINLYKLEENELMQLMGLKKHALEIFLHQSNFDDLYSGYEPDLLTRIKLRLYPGFNPALETRNRVRVSKLWQKNIFKDLDLNQICDIIVSNPEFKKEGMRVLKIIEENQDIRDKLYELIIRWIDWFMPNVEMIFLNPKYELLILSPWDGGQQTLDSCIVFGLFPKDFFSLRGTGIATVTEEIQISIFNLLGLRDISKILEGYKGPWNRNYDLVAFFQEKQAITELCDIIVNNYWNELVEILVTIPGLEGLPNYINGSIDGYKDLCIYIRERIIPQNATYKKLGKATNNWEDILKIYPEGFFLLEKTSISVNPEIQQQIFGLLFENKHMLACILAKLGYNRMQDIASFVRQPKTVATLRNMVIGTCWKRLKSILTELPQLGGLPKSQSWRNNHYKRLSRLILKKIRPRSPIFEELKKATNDWKDLLKIYPGNFFPLAKINSETQERMFELLFEDKYKLIAVLVREGYQEQKEHQIESFIKQDKVITELRNMIVCYYRKELMDILIRKVPELSRHIDSHNLSEHTYQELCHIASIKVISKDPVYEELLVIANSRTDIFKLCPDNFFPLENIGIEIIKPATQQLIFELLFIKKHSLASLLTELGYPQQTELTIQDFIKQKKVRNALRDMVVILYWVELVKILSKVLRSRLPWQIYWPENAYQALCYAVSESRSAVYNELNNRTYDLSYTLAICPNNFFPLEETGLVVDPSIQQDIFGLLFKDKENLIDILIQLGCGQQETCNIKEFIKQEWVMNKLRNMVIRNYWEELISLVTKAPNLKWLRLLVSPVKDSWSWSKDAYQELCDFILNGFIPRSIVYRELMQVTEGWNNIISICPNNFFSLGKVGIHVPSSTQLRIFELLFENKYNMAGTLVQLGYKWREGFDVQEFIKEKQIVTHLCNIIVSNYREQLVEILIKVPRLERLPKDRNWSSYKDLCNFISREILSNNLIEDNLREMLRELSFNHQSDK